MTNDDNVRAEVIALLNELHSLPPKLSLIGPRSPRIEDIQGLQGFELTQQWGYRLAAVVDQTLSEAYRRIALSCDAILRLASDDHLEELVKKLSRYASEEIGDFRTLITEIQDASDEGDAKILMTKWGDDAVRAMSLRREFIVALTAGLEKYFRSAA